jgi:GNAT superfamily N-acetyltransferase
VPDLAVRPVTVHDSTAVEPLLADALDHLHALRGGAALLEAIGVPEAVTAGALASALCGDALVGVSTLVAEAEGAVAGVAVLVRTGRGFDLLGVHAAKSSRRQRVGTTLLETARGIAAGEGVPFEALALPGDQTSKSLFESMGFKARLLRMSADR